MTKKCGNIGTLLNTKGPNLEGQKYKFNTLNFIFTEHYLYIEKIVIIQTKFSRVFNILRALKFNFGLPKG